LVNMKIFVFELVSRNFLEKWNIWISWYMAGSNAIWWTGEGWKTDDGND
jgi:hypothetical protein